MLYAPRTRRPASRPCTAMTPPPRLRTLLTATLAVLAMPAAADAAERPTAHTSYVAGEVIVRYERSADRAAHARAHDPRRPERRRDAARAARPARGRDRRAEPDRARERLLPAGPRQR